MKSKLTILIVSLLAVSGTAQTEAPSMEDIFRQMQQQMQQMMDQLSQDNDLMQVDTFFFFNPGEPGAPFGVLPPTTEDARMEQLLDSLRKSIEGRNELPFLDLSEFFRSFGEIQMEPIVPAPENKPNPQPEDKRKPNKKRKVYRL